MTPDEPDRNGPQPVAQTPAILLTADEVNWLTGQLVKLPYENVAPVIQLLGQKMMALRK